MLKIHKFLHSVHYRFLFFTDNQVVRKMKSVLNDGAINTIYYFSLNRFFLFVCMKRKEMLLPRLSVLVYVSMSEYARLSFDNFLVRWAAGWRFLEVEGNGPFAIIYLRLTADQIPISITESMSSSSLVIGVRSTAGAIEFFCTDFTGPTNCTSFLSLARTGTKQ